MAFQGTITNAGRAFEAQLKAAGKPMIYDRVTAGTGYAADPAVATALLDARCEFYLKYTEPINDRIEIYTTLNNGTVMESFLWQQWGLWATDGEGTHVLYLLAQEPAGQTIDPGSDIVDYKQTIILSGDVEVTVVVDPLGPLTQADIGRTFGVAPLDGEQKVPLANLPELNASTILESNGQSVEANQRRQDEEIEELQEDMPRSGLLTIPATGWQPVSSGSQEAEDGATVYLDIPLAGALATDKVHGELVPETREIARDAGMLDYTRVVTARSVRVYAESVPTGAVSLQVTRIPANAAEVNPVGYIAGLQAGGGIVLVSYTAVQTGGISGSQDSTGIVITFSKAVKGLTADDITITNGTGTVVKGSLSGDGTTWTIGVSTTVQGSVSVFVRSFGDYFVTTEFQTVQVYAKTRVTFTVTQLNGSTSANTTAIRITFSAAVTGLLASHITLTNGTGSATKGALSGGGTTWDLTINATRAGNVSVAIANFGSFVVTSGAQSVNIYAPIANLYNSGDEYTSLTGGWKLDVYQSQSSAVKNATNVTLTAVAQASTTHRSARMITVNRITLTGYSRLRITAQSLTGDGDARGIIGIRDSNTTFVGNFDYLAKREDIQPNSSVFTAELNIGSLSSGYVEVQTSNNASATVNTVFVISKVELIP